MIAVRARLLLFLALAWPLPLPAATEVDALATATTSLARAGDALAAAEAAPDRLAPLARAVADYAKALAAVRSEVQAAGEREDALAIDFDLRRLEIARLLAAMQAMSATTPQAIHPQGPLAAARAAIMLDRVGPSMRAQATELVRQVTEMQAARERQDSGLATVGSGLERLTAAESLLEAAMTRAEPGPGEIADPALSTLARDSTSLSALAEALAKMPGAPTPPEGQAEGFDWPVAGRVVQQFDEPDAARVRRPGVLVATAPRALVTAPADALVRYAGPFLEYGYVVVLAPEPETMLVLAGLSRLQVRTGASVQRGDLLGLMGGRPPDVEEYVMLPEAGTGAAGGETLYIEVRHGRGPVDPEPLFVGQNG